MAGEVTCPACSTPNEPGRKFCGECGAPLARSCESCGTVNPPGTKFCGECGTALTAPASEPSPSPAAAPSPTAERRLVSVLFADLVGFTSASEGRDAEETRDLLSRYFDTCRTVIERYGGTVEKFIGDAVMAVWGTPVAMEDDAERAVRAALDLVATVPDLDPAVQARAGVLTGEAAVTLGAQAEGMVAGDLVNTASRIQSAAEPGTVLVGDSTRRATEAAIAYGEPEPHELKGKSEPTALSRALRVTAGRGGAQKSAGLEAPFVGRNRELRLVKELFHACAEERRAQLVSVVGVAGHGKSRLGWEFFKYMDGLSEEVWWHRGRCLAYGEGVAFWALAEMVRMRAGIVEGEEPESARAKLRASLQEHLADDDERAFVEPRLGHLLGLDEGGTWGKEELFGAWRLLFERLAEQGPLALLFEDLHWADAALIEFISHLLEWSRQYPIFVLCLSRPDLQERHPEFGHGPRQTTLSLEPLSARAMEALLEGYVPGLPEELRAQILARAEGVPLYAVETVRMLLDRGVLVPKGGVYRPSGPIGELEVPETLHGLIAARLDGLEPEERRLLQDASVLGKTFTRQAVAAITDLPDGAIEPLLAGLVRKEVLGVQADPRSPERGQYGFLQDLVRRVAYETLARTARKERHLAAAAHLAESFGAAEQEIVEVVAAHYLAAYEAQPDAGDAEAIRATARELLARAGERAGSLAATGEARRYFEQAAELADDPVDRARLLERAGEMAFQAAELETAERLYNAALELLIEADETHAVARVSGLLGRLEAVMGRQEQAVARMERALAAVAADEPDADVAALAATLGTTQFMAGATERAVEPTELALTVAEALRLPAVLCRSLVTKAWITRTNGRPEEALALLRHALSHALENDLSELTSIAYGNLSDGCFASDRYGEALELLDRALVHVRRVGERRNELFVLSEMSYALAMTGRWRDALATYAELPEEQLRVNTLLTSPLSAVVDIFVQQGRLEEATTVLAIYDHLEGTADEQNRAMREGARAVLLYAQGQYAEALEGGAAAMLEIGPALGSQGAKLGFVWGVEAALALGARERAVQFLAAVDAMPPGLRPPFFDAHTHRFRARLDEDESGFKLAAAGFREYNLPFWLAVTLLEHGESLREQGRPTDAEPLLAEAREIFERLEAAPWLERAAGAAPRVEVTA